jgi:predicted Zn finger-like uncharacterized protein
LIIECSACQARYHYDESRFGGAASKKIRCTKCSVIFEIRNPGAEADAGAAASNAAPAPAARTSASLPGPDEFTLDEASMTAPGRRKQAPGAPARAMPLVEQKPAAPRPPAPPVPAMTGPIPQMPVEPVGMTSAAARTTDRVPVAGAAATSPDRRLRLPGSYRLSLACIAGPDSGRIFEIEKARVVIGRANADIVLADIQCSRNHAALEILDDKVTLVDLGSTNGTYVGDQRVNRLELENRSEFEIGTTTLMLIRSATDAPSGT